MSEMMLTKSRKEEEIASLKERLKATQDVAYFVRDALKKLETKIKDEKLIIENTILFSSISKKIAIVLHVTQQELLRWFHPI